MYLVPSCELIHSLLPLPSNLFNVPLPRGSEAGNHHYCVSLRVVSNMSGVTSEQEFYDMHNDLCEVCSEPGKLLCCATCNLVFHRECTRPELDKEPDDNWMCTYCVSHGVSARREDTKARREASRGIWEMGLMKKQFAEERASRRAREELTGEEEEEGLGEDVDVMSVDEEDKKPAARYALSSMQFASMMANIERWESATDGPNTNYRKWVRKTDKKKKKGRGGVSGDEAGLMVENEASELSDEDGDIDVEGEDDAKATRQMEKKQEEEGEESEQYDEFGASEDEDGKLVVDVGPDSEMKLEEISEREGKSAARQKIRTNLFVFNNPKLISKALHGNLRAGREWLESKAALPGSARDNKIKNRNIDCNSNYYHYCGRTRLDDTDEEADHFRGGELDRGVEGMATPNSKRPCVPWGRILLDSDDDMEWEAAGGHFADEDSVSSSEVEYDGWGPNGVNPECWADCDVCKQVSRRYVRCYHESLTLRGCGRVVCLKCAMRREVPSTG